MADNDPLQIRVQQLKTFHGIKGDIALQFKLQDNGGLSVLYNSKWLPLTHQRDPSKFSAGSTLKMYGVGFMRALKLMPEAKAKLPVFQAPKMNELRKSMMEDYILDEPISEVLHKPLAPLKRGLTTKTLEFRQTHFTFANYLKK